MSATTNSAVIVQEIGNGIVQVILDMPGSSANVLTVELFAELDATFSELQQRTDLNGLILSSAKPSIFVAGADLKRINSTLDWPDKNIIQFCEDGRAVMARLSQMPFITVAAIHGACVGGGLELPLWCDYRIASNHRRTMLGLPEVKLGLVPGWAGTVRLPRIANLEAAVDLVTSGRVAKPDEALSMGFVDQVVEPDQLIEAATELVNQESFDTSERIRSEVLGAVERAGDIAAIRTEYSQRISNNQSIFPFACEVVLEHMLTTAEKPHDEACHGESLAMAKVYGSDPSYGLLNNFFLGEHNKKNPGFVDVKLADKTLKTIGIVGCGLMGTSIAENCLRSGNDVVLFDASKDAIHKATDALKPIAESKNVQCSAAEGFSGLADCDLVIESVVEVTEVKKSVLEKIELACGNETLIATNTSAIPLSKLSTVLSRPENFCGIHFCHPELMQLVEVVKSEAIGKAKLANIVTWVRQLRKMPVVVKDRAGFVVNRMLAAMLDQAFRLYSHGHSIESIDAAMRQFGFLGGPFEIVDVIGTEVCMYAGREMYDGGVNCVTLSPILPKMVKKNFAGRRSLKGFYRYESIDGDRIWDPQIDELLGDYVTQEDASIQPDDFALSICSCMLLEASRILDDGIAADARDIDICIVNGFSFPAHVGGILFWADRIGISKVNSMLTRLAQFDKKLAPTPTLLKMENESGRFYGG